MKKIKLFSWQRAGLVPQRNGKDCGRTGKHACQRGHRQMTKAEIAELHDAIPKE